MINPISSSETPHFPVMLDEITRICSPDKGGIYIDCTFGGGGYSKAILNFPGTKVIAFDRDKLTSETAKILSKKFPKRFNFFQEKFSNINKIIEKNLKPRAIIFDLGLSSFQLSDPNRGFSFKSENFLNMEMGLNNQSAYEVVNFLDKKYLGKIIKILGDEKDGKKIANIIDKYRRKKPIKTSEELAKIICIAKKNYNKFKKNPATKTFQAIRIFVNKEISELTSGLIESAKILSNDGMIIVVNFHSIEDKIVKNFFNICSNSKKNPSRYLPFEEAGFNLFKKISKKPVFPEKVELNENPNSRSAKLRYAIRSDDKFIYPKDFKSKFAHILNLENGVV